MLVVCVTLSLEGAPSLGQMGSELIVAGFGAWQTEVV